MSIKHYLYLFFLILPTYVISQKVDITGTITNSEDQTPLIGVSVIEVGTNNGALSNETGQYKLSVQAGSQIRFSYIGFQAQIITATTSGTQNIALVSEISTLDEVVVVGYTTQKKKDITAAISVVNLKSIENAPYSNVLQSLAGKASGITLTQDGQPGTGRTSIKVRGVTTLNNNQPLYVVDGIPTEEDLSNLNPNDIESIQVLKDAASASIYGSRAAGGVIVVTTKKGKAGKLSLDAGTQFGMQTLGRRIDLLNATQWGEVYWQAAQNDGLTPRHPIYGNGATPVVPAKPFLIPNGKQVYRVTPEGTDWYDAVYQNALSQQHYVNLTNGNERGSYMAGGSYFGQNGLIRQTYFDRITGRFNSTLNIAPWLTVGENLSLAFSNQVQIGNQQGQDGIPLDVIRQHPALPVYDVEGNYAGKIGGLPDVRNMVSVLEKNKDNTTESWRVFGNAYAQFDVLKLIFPELDHHTLSLKTNYGIDYSNYYARRFDARFSEGDFDVQNNLLNNTFGKGLTTTWTNSLQYNYDQGKHRAQVFGGSEVISYDYTFLSGTRTDFLIEDPAFTYLNSGAGTSTTQGGGTSWGLVSYFGRGDYTFDDRYIVSATVRYDLTSRFAAAGIFPAVSLGWRISEEQFFQNLAGKRTGLKLRVSYGQQGNQRSVGDFANLSTLGPDINHADYDLLGTNTGVVQGFRVIRRGNPNLRWENTTQYNAGFDLGLLDDRITLSVDYYRKNTTGVLLSAPLLAAQGEGQPPVKNAATIVNNGLDLSIGYQYMSSGGFTYETDANVTYFTNEVTDLGENIGSTGYEGEKYIVGGDGPTRVAVGYPIGVFYGWVADGLFQNDGEVDGHAIQDGKDVGRIRYQDLNGDGRINDEDRTYLGSPYPDVSFGWSFSTGYKGLSFAASLYGAAGQQVYNEVRWYMDFAQVSNFNRSTRILDAWSPGNTDSDIPAPTLSNANNENRASSYFIENANYLKVRSLRLNYRLPASLFKNVGVSVYAEAQNVAVLTKYTGIDPEVPYAGNANYPGIDRGVYPLPRTYLAGLNIKM